ncbi:MAG: permease [Dermabacter sp.]|nr:permease [Dermabacter sp.]
MSPRLQALALVLRRRSGLTDLLPLIAFAASAGIISTVLAGTVAFWGRVDAASGADPMASALTFIAMCAVLACVLLLPSAVGLGGAAARLSLTRRERDLAATRLVGGTALQVSGSAVIDASLQALIGGVIGLGLHIAAAWPLTALDFGMAPFTPSELMLPVWAWPLVPVGLAILAAGSAAVALTGVSLSPLGIARNSRVVRMSVVRILVWGVLIVAFLGAALLLPKIDGVSLGFLIVMILGTLGAMLVGVNIAGPFLVWIIALLLAKTSPWPSLLVGARRVAGAPIASWRTVSGVTIALVVAALTSIIAMFGGATTPEEQMLFTAFGTGGLLTVGIAAVLAAVSTGVAQAARVLDEAPAYRAQHMAGAGIAQLHRARIAEIAIPVGLALGVATFMSALVLASLAGSSLSNPAVATQYLIAVLVSLVLVVGSTLASGPLMTRAAKARRRVL